MLYQLKHGRTESSVIAQAVKRGRDGIVILPKPIANAPDLEPWNAIFYRAFWELCADRINDSQIPFVARYTWARARGLDAEATEWLIYLVGKMDLAYLDHCRHNANREVATSGDAGEAGAAGTDHGRPARIRTGNAGGR